MLKTKKWEHDAVMAAAFIATFFFKVNIILIILCAACAGVLMALKDQRGGG